jgi:uncharacterized protein (DUF1330 family)
MKQYFGLGVGLHAGALIGAAAVTGLHAQAKPPVYVINEIDVHDPDGYVNEFVPKALASIKEATGARFVAVGGSGGGAKPITAIEGTPPKRVTVHVWDSLDAFKAWYNGKEFQETLQIGLKYASWRRYAVEGQ